MRLLLVLVLAVTSSALENGFYQIYTRTREAGRRCLQAEEGSELVYPAVCSKKTLSQWWYIKKQENNAYRLYTDTRTSGIWAMEAFACQDLLRIQPANSGNNNQLFTLRSLPTKDCKIPSFMLLCKTKEEGLQAAENSVFFPWTQIVEPQSSYSTQRFFFKKGTPPPEFPCSSSCSSSSSSDS